MIIRFAPLLALPGILYALQTWKVDDESGKPCIFIESDPFIHLKLENKGNTHIYDLAINGTTHVTGDCGTDDANKQFVKIDFNPNGVINGPKEEMWSITFFFEREDDNAFVLSDYDLKTSSRTWLFGTTDRTFGKVGDPKIRHDSSILYQVTAAELLLEDDASIELKDLKLTAFSDVDNLEATESSMITKRDVTAEWPTTSLDHSTNCPSDKSGLGRSTWTLLHTMSVYYPECADEEKKIKTRLFLDSLAQSYPCGWCAKDMQQYIQSYPPTLDSQEDFAEWVCQLHNHVNKKTHKAQFDCTKVFERWRDGWQDGSCKKERKRFL